MTYLTNNEELLDAKHVRTSEPSPDEQIIERKIRDATAWPNVPVARNVTEFSAHCLPSDRPEGSTLVPAGAPVPRIGEGKNQVVDFLDQAFSLCVRLLRSRFHKGADQ